MEIQMTKEEALEVVLGTTNKEIFDDAFMQFVRRGLETIHSDDERISTLCRQQISAFEVGCTTFRKMFARHTKKFGKREFSLIRRLNAMDDRQLLQEILGPNAMVAPQLIATIVTIGSIVGISMQRGPKLAVLAEEIAMLFVQENIRYHSMLNAGSIQRAAEGSTWRYTQMIALEYFKSIYSEASNPDVYKNRPEDAQIGQTLFSVISDCAYQSYKLIADDHIKKIYG